MKPEKRKKSTPSQVPEERDDLLAPEEDEEEALYHRAYLAPEDWDDREFCRNTTTWD